MSDTAAPQRPSLLSILTDLRSIIALLFTVYGVVLVIIGVSQPVDAIKTGGLNINLWVGLIMLVFAALMWIWSFLRPVLPPTAEELAERQALNEGVDFRH